MSVQSDNRTAAELQSGPAILMQIVDINCKNKFDENWAMTDIPIKVNVKGYSSASFTRAAIDTLIARGEEAAMQQWERLWHCSSALPQKATSTQHVPRALCRQVRNLRSR